MKSDDIKTDSPTLGYAPADIPEKTGGVVSLRRVFADMKSGRLRAKKVGPLNLITVEDAKSYVNSFPDRPTTKPAA
jgi:hypothetical protein